MISMAHELSSKPIREWYATVKTLEEQPNFEHCKTEALHDSLMQISIEPIPDYELLLQLFRQASISLSHCQASTVKHCIAHSLKTQRSLWRVGAGMGKSHLIGFASLLLLNLKPEANVYIVYSSEDLMKKDAHLFEAVKRIMKSGSKLKLTLAKSSIKPKSNDFVLIDECDEVYFSYLAWFERTLSTPTIVGFTATPPSQQESLESQILHCFFGESIFDSKLSL